MPSDPHIHYFIGYDWYDNGITIEIMDLNETMRVFNLDPRKNNENLKIFKVTIEEITPTAEGAGEINPLTSPKEG